MLRFIYFVVLVSLMIFSPTIAQDTSMWRTIDDVAWNVDGTLYAVAYGDEEFVPYVGVFDVSGRQIWQAIASNFDWHPIEPDVIAIASGKSWTQLPDDGTRTVKIIEVNTGHQRLSISREDIIDGLTGWRHTPIVDWDATGETIATAIGENWRYGDLMARIWDVETGDMLTQVRLGLAWPMQFYYDGERLLTSYLNPFPVYESVAVSVVERRQGEFERVATIIGEEFTDDEMGFTDVYDVRVIGYIAESDTLLTHEVGYIQFRTLPDYEISEEVRVPGAILYNVDLVRGGDAVTSYISNNVYVIDMNDLSVIYTYESPKPISAIALNPVADDLLIGYSDGTLEMIDMSFDGED